MMHSRRWSDLSRGQFAGLDRARTILVLPVGAIEQHGPHRPVSVDRDLAETVVERALEHCADDLAVLCLPGFAYGKSNEHEAIPGTISLSVETLLRLLDDIAASLARTGFRRLILLNAHGGNTPVLEIAARDTKIRHGLQVAVCSWYTFNEADRVSDEREHAFGIHGGLIETSAMLAIAPHLVNMGAAADFANAAERWEDQYHYLGMTPGRSRPAWVIEELNSEGAAGNAAGASRTLGEQLLSTAARNFAAFLSEFEHFCQAQDQKSTAR